MSISYQLNRLKDNTSNGVQPALQKLQASLLPAAEQAGYRVWGIFFGLFGLATNELYLVTMRDQPDDALSDLIAAESLQLQQTFDLIPTVRPVQHEPRTARGIYVFRWFDVRTQDVTEIAQLSEAAWVTFEGGFDTEVQGLFAERKPDADLGKMLLVTRYRDLSVWEASRRPPPEAGEHFAKRHQLTIEATPIATRLVGAV
jgi:hypothetical protein|tara:strand:- start:73 stop:675 length:603 start_codon:yes stop_codon:yes gene_type:complete